MKRISQLAMYERLIGVELCMIMNVCVCVEQISRLYTLSINNSLV